MVGHSDWVERWLAPAVGIGRNQMSTLFRKSIFALVAMAAPSSTQTDKQAESCNAADNSKIHIRNRLLDARRTQANPADVVAHENRGLSYVRLHLYDRAIGDFGAAIRLNPQDAGAFNNRGDAYGSLSQFQRAVTDFSDAIRLDPPMVEAYAGRSLAYKSLGQMDRAKNRCRSGAHT